VPATSVPSECLFSSAGDMITKKRNSIKPAKAEKVIFLMNNLYIDCLVLMTLIIVRCCMSSTVAQTLKL